MVLTKLELSGNRIGNEGAIAIAEALKVNAVLTTLFLNDNQIGDEGAKAIAEALKSGTAVLTELRLDWINIGDDDAKAIAESLKVNAVRVLQGRLRRCLPQADSSLRPPPRTGVRARTTFAST